MEELKQIKIKSVKKQSGFILELIATIFIDENEVISTQWILLLNKKTLAFGTVIQFPKLDFQEDKCPFNPMNLFDFGTGFIDKWSDASKKLKATISSKKKFTRIKKIKNHE